MTELNAELARRAIVEHTRRLAESAAAAGPNATVPTAPQWTITDLVEHVGQTQHWVAEIIERRITTQLPTQMAVLPSKPGDWQAWLSESRNRALRELVLDVPAPVVATLLGYSHPVTQRHAEHAAAAFAHYVSPTKPPTRASP